MTPQEFGYWFLEWNRRRGIWSQATFGTVTERGPTGPLKHLEKEAREAYQEQDRDKRLEEYSDCMHLIMDAVDRDGYSAVDLLKAIERKLIKNMMRKWNKPTTDAPVDHIRDEKPPADTVCE